MPRALWSATLHQYLKRPCRSRSVFVVRAPGRVFRIVYTCVPPTRLSLKLCGSSPKFASSIVTCPAGTLEREREKRYSSATAWTRAGKEAASAVWDRQGRQRASAHTETRSTSAANARCRRRELISGAQGGRSLPRSG